MKLTKKRYLQGFVAVTLVLALVRQLLPVSPTAAEPAEQEQTEIVERLTTNVKKHRIWSVHN